MYKTIVFDLDGTLLDTIGDLCAAGNYVCREHGWPEHTPEAFQLMVGHGMINLMTQLSPPEGRDPDTIADTHRRFNAYYAEHSMDLTRPFPGMAELAGRLRRDGAKMAVYSNKDDQFSQVLIRTFFPGCFDVVLGKREGFPVKPDPAGARWVLGELEKAGADTARTLYVGDSATDIQTGHNAGLSVCAVTWGYRPRASLLAAGPDFLADTPEELEAFIRRG